jgi:hypothetical protein
MTQWKLIPNTGNLYAVSSDGDIQSFYKKTPRLLKQKIDRAGYRVVTLSIDKKHVSKFVHRLVAEAFLDNPYNKEEVNHLNGEKTDNRLSNLEWATHTENMQHAYQIGLCKPIGKKVINGKTGVLFDSIKEAALDIGMNPGTCRNYLNGNIKHNPTDLRYARRYYVYILPANWLEIQAYNNLDAWKSVRYA